MIDFKNKLFLLTIISSIIFFNSYSQNSGDLDLTFGTGGKVIVNIHNDIGGYSVIQPDGKILLAGYVDSTNRYKFAVLRFDTCGRLDNSFGNNGKAVFSVGTQYDICTAIALQPDGKILLAGKTMINSGEWRFAVARLKSDGTFDSTFADDGVVNTHVQGWDMPEAMVIQPDGKILVTGSSNNGTQNDFAIVRYNSDGTLDNTFSEDGIVLTPVGEADDYPTSIALQSDGRIIVCGLAKVVSWKLTLVCYNPDGSLCNSFGTNGMVFTEVGENASGNEIKIQNDGKIVMVGTSSKGPGYNYPVFVVARYNANGTLDNSFSSDGIVTTSIGPIDDVAYSVVIQPDNKILVGGAAKNNSNPYIIHWDYAVARYKSDGSLDNSFSGDGKLTFGIELHDDRIISINLQANGKIVLSGYSKNQPESLGFDLTMARLHNYIIDDIPEENVGSVDILIYPNPANDKFYIEVPEKTDIEIYNLEGQMMRSYNNAGKVMTIDIENFSSGIYIIQAKTSEGIWVRKFIKQ